MVSWYDRRDSLAMALGGGARSRPRVLLAAAGVEAQGSGHDVVGHLREWTIVAEGVRPQPDEGLADADVELDGDHARGLVHHIVEVGARLQLGRQLPRRRVRLQTRTAWAAMSAMTNASAC